MTAIVNDPLVRKLQETELKMRKEKTSSVNLVLTDSELAKMIEALTNQVLLTKDVNRASVAS